MDINLENKVIHLYTSNIKILEICKQANLSTATIYKVLNKHNIVRGIGNSDKVRFQLKYQNITKDSLEDLYFNQQLVVSEMATKLDIREDIVRRLMLSYDIKLRNMSEHLALPRQNELHRKRMTKITNNSDFKKKVSKISKKMWADRNYKAPKKQLEAMQSDEYRKKMRKVILERHRSEWHEKIKPLIHIGLIRCWKNNPKFRETISNYTKLMRQKVMSDPILYQKWKTNHAIAVSDDGYRLRRSEFTKRLWINPEYRQKMLEAAKRMWGEGKLRQSIIQKIIASRINQPTISTQQNILYEILRSLNIKYEREKVIGFFSFDCFLPEYNLLIEVNGDYWHNLPKAIRNDKSKATYIERYFSQYTLKYLWEHEFKCKDRIINLLKYWTRKDIIEKQFKFHQVSFKLIETPEAKSFLEKYHYTNKIGNNTIRLGYFLNNELIAVIVYGHVVRNETATRLNYDSKDVLELSRLAIHPLYQKKNFASWMISKSINYIKKNHSNIRLLISFADSTFNHDGTIYKASNWVLDGIVEPSYWYVDKDGYVMHKKTLWDHAKSLKLSENDFAKRYNYNKVKGKEKTRFVYYLER